MKTTLHQMVENTNTISKFIERELKGMKFEFMGLVQINKDWSIDLLDGGYLGDTYSLKDMIQSNKENGVK